MCKSRGEFSANLWLSWDVWGQGRATRGHPVCDRAAFPLQLVAWYSWMQIMINHALHMEIRHWKGFEPPTHGMSNSMVSTCCSLSSSTSTCTDCNAKSESKEACELWTQKHHVASARNMLIPSRAWETNCLESNLRKDMQKKQNLTMYQQFLSNNVQKNLEAPWRISEYQRSRLTHEDIMIIMPSSHNERWRTSPTLLRGEIPGHWWCQLLKARK